MVPPLHIDVVGCSLCGTNVVVRLREGLPFPPAARIVILLLWLRRFILEDLFCKALVKGRKRRRERRDMAVVRKRKQEDLQLLLSERTNPIRAYFDFGGSFSNGAASHVAAIRNI